MQIIKPGKIIICSRAPTEERNVEQKLTREELIEDGDCFTWCFANYLITQASLILRKHPFVQLQCTYVAFAPD